MKERKLLWLISLLLLIACWFSLGFSQSDEHFQILEFAGLKLGINQPGDLAWEFHEKMRPTLQPTLVFIIYKLWEGLGVSNPLPTVAQEVLPELVLRGKKIFYNAEDARMSKDGYLSCATCHLDGGQDGSSYDLTHLGEGIRNTIALNGKSGLSHGRLHWTANFDEVQDFENQIRILNEGLGFISDADYHFGVVADPLGAKKEGLSPSLDALAAYIKSLDSFPTSPFRVKGGLTLNGQRGKKVFEQYGCGGCHAGPDFTDSPTELLHDIGTIRSTSGYRLGQPLLGLDVPTLKGLWATGPYLHDGSAKNLAEVFISGNGTLFHTPAGMSDREKEDLVAYLLQLDEQEIGNHPAFRVAIQVEEKESVVPGVSSVGFSVASDLPDITKIEYYLNGQLAGTSRAEQDIFTPIFPTGGAYLLQAKIYHHGGTQATVADRKLAIAFTNCRMQVTLGPNPFRDEIRVDVPGLASFRYTIRDVSCRVMKAGNVKDRFMKIDSSDWPAGIYLLTIFNQACRQTTKIVKVY